MPPPRLHSGCGRALARLASCARRTSVLYFGRTSSTSTPRLLLAACCRWQCGECGNGGGSGGTQATTGSLLQVWRGAGVQVWRGADRRGYRRVQVGNGEAGRGESVGRGAAKRRHSGGRHPSLPRSLMWTRPQCSIASPYCPSLPPFYTGPERGCVHSAASPHLVAPPSVPPSLLPRA